MSLQVIGTGNIGRDLKQIRTVKGKDGREYKVTDFSICFDEVQKKADGTYEQSSAIWARVVVWNALAEKCYAHLTKGSRVHVTGKMKLEQWTDGESGEEREMLQVEATDVNLSLYRLDTFMEGRAEAAA
jgi:single-strand DNA-binding protein